MFSAKHEDECTKDQRDECRHQEYRSQLSVRVTTATRQQPQLSRDWNHRSVLKLGYQEALSQISTKLKYSVKYSP